MLRKFKRSLNSLQLGTTSKRKQKTTKNNYLI